MSMSRRHYQMMAMAISVASGGNQLMISKKKVVDTLAQYFKADNPNFDKDIFREACK